MFIKDLILENFQNLQTGLGITKLHIDFTKQRNPVCIIIGPNGAGKTSLLSYMTPFATVGDLDIRNATKPIIEGKNGYKKIILVDEEQNEFEIEHFYTPKADKNFTIKSYIKMNGLELNPNGNVTSFKELVAEYLDIEMSYLKLIRMGDNVKNLISCKSTERKQFSAKLLEEVDWYLKKYKEISQKERDLKAVMSHIVDEISKTGIVDTEEAEASVKEMKDHLKEVEKKLLKAQNDKATIEYELDKLDDKDQLDFKYRSAEKKISTFKKALHDAKNRNLDLKSATEKMIEFEKKVSTKEAELEAITKEIENLLRDIDNGMNELDDLNEQIKKEEDNSNLSSLEEYHKNIVKKKADSYRSSFDNCNFQFSKDEFEEFMIFLKNIQNLLNITYEYGKDPIRHVLKAMLDKEDIPTIITSSLVAIEAQENAERLSIIDRIINKYSGVKVDCKENCVLKQMHSEIMDIKDAVPVSDVKYTSEFYQMMKLAYENLSAIFSQINEKKDFIQKLPDNIKIYFVTENLYKRIGNCECIYDDKVLNDYLSFLTEMDNYRKLEKECDEIEKEIRHIKSISRIDFLEVQRERKTDQLETYQYRLKDKRTLKEHKEISLASTRQEVHILHNIVDALTSYDEAQKVLDEVKETKEKYSELSSKFISVNKEVNKYLIEKDELSQQVFKKESNIQKYKEYIKTLEENRLVYEDYSNLKFSLSGTTGIPLEHIRLYFKEVTKVANELLDIVYDGKLYLDKLIITESDFLMPYVKNGKVIEDVSCASQGETSFFNMAISSALRAISMTRYNIGLYDEVDSQFDDSNRQKFIPVLEKQLELNHIQQAFVITHNLMFHQYPVDIINLGDLDNSTLDIDYL